MNASVQLLLAIDAHLSNWSSSPPTPSHSYAQLFAHRASFATYQQTLRRTWLKEKSDTRELLANVRNKLRTYGLKGYEPEEGLRVEVRSPVHDRIARSLSLR
jgi:hypothetical protein